MKLPITVIASAFFALSGCQTVEEAATAKVQASALMADTAPAHGTTTTA